MPSYSRFIAYLLKTGISSFAERINGEQGPDSGPLVKDSPPLKEKFAPGSDQSRRSVPRSPLGHRRTIVGFLAAFLLGFAGLSAVTTWMTELVGSQSTRDFVIAAMTRIGLVLGAIWLAWDSMKRPASWLPPGIAMAGVIGIVIVAAQPKLILAVLPLMGGLVAISSVLRAFRGR